MRNARKRAGTLNWKPGVSPAQVLYAFFKRKASHGRERMEARPGGAYCCHDDVTQNACPRDKHFYYLVLSVSIELFCGRTALAETAEQGNRVRIPDGTAAVCAESVSRCHWVYPRRRKRTPEALPSISVSQKTYKEVVSAPILRADLGTQEHGCGIFVAAVFLFLCSRCGVRGGTYFTMKQSQKDALAMLATTWDGKADPPHEAGVAFDPQTPEGRQLYESFSDEELAALLWSAAQRLGHSPAQREVFPVYRAYLKMRFGKWPYALRAAGLHTSAGRDGAQVEDSAQTAQLLAAVRKAAVDLGRMPHPSDLPEICRMLSRQFASWSEVLKAAEVRRVRTVYRMENLDSETRAQLNRLYAEALDRGRAPLRSEVEPAVREQLTRVCGSWRNALYQIGLEPVTHIHPFRSTSLRPSKGRAPRHGSALYDCLYRLLSPDAQLRADLEALRALAETLGHTPGRKEVPDALRRRLQDGCGSFANAVYQLQPKNATTRGE